MYWLKKVKNKIIGFDYFELGNSFALQYLVMFLAFPIVVLLRLPSPNVQDVINQNMMLLNVQVTLYLGIGFIAFLFGYNIFGSKIKNFKKITKFSLQSKKPNINSNVKVDHASICHTK